MYASSVNRITVLLFEGPEVIEKNNGITKFITANARQPVTGKTKCFIYNSISQNIMYVGFPIHMYCSRCLFFGEI